VEIDPQHYTLAKAKGIEVSRPVKLLDATTFSGRMKKLVETCEYATTRAYFSYIVA